MSKQECDKKLTPDELVNRIQSLIYNTEGLTYAQVVGIMEMIKNDLIEEAREDD